MSTTATPDRFATPPILVAGAQKPGRMHIVPIRQVAGF
jgi:hypothetical protein